MQAHDVFNRAFDDATAAIEAWLPTIARDATVDRERTEQYWRVRLTPHQAEACPVELMLSRSQMFDCDVGPESAVGLHISDLGLFLPLLKAVVEGRVVLRTWSALATGSELVREMIVDVATAQQWTVRRLVQAGAAATEATAVASDHVYVAYRRA